MFFHTSCKIFAAVDHCVSSGYFYALQIRFCTADRTLPCGVILQIDRTIAVCNRTGDTVLFMAWCIEQTTFRIRCCHARFIFYHVQRTFCTVDQEVYIYIAVLIFVTVDDQTGSLAVCKIRFGRYQICFCHRTVLRIDIRYQDRCTVFTERTSTGDTNIQTVVINCRCTGTLSTIIQRLDQVIQIYFSIRSQIIRVQIATLCREIDSSIIERYITSYFICLCLDFLYRCACIFIHNHQGASLIYSKYIIIIGPGTCPPVTIVAAARACP